MAAAETKVKGKTKAGMQTQKWLLTKIAKDERITPSKRILCTLLLGYIEGIYPFTLIEDVYGSPTRIKYNGTEQEEKEVPVTDGANQSAAADLRELYREFADESTKG